MKANSRTILFVAIAALAGSAVLLASGPAGCYTIVEKVILEPNDAKPERIQVWGLFSVTDGKPGNGYLNPQPGYLYFSLDKNKETATLAEWKDLKTVAGSGSVVTFAERPSWRARVRLASESPKSPDLYPLYNGITRVVTGNGLGSIDNPAVIAQLRAVLRPVR